jgi:hypothetical protein
MFVIVHFYRHKKLLLQIIFFYFRWVPNIFQATIFMLFGIYFVLIL